MKPTYTKNIHGIICPVAEGQVSRVWTWEKKKKKRLRNLLFAIAATNDDSF